MIARGWPADGPSEEIAGTGIARPSSPMAALEFASHSIGSECAESLTKSC